MAMKIQASVTVSNWEEVTLEEVGGGAKITQAQANTRYSGSIEGEGRVIYIMTYLPSGEVPFLGYERVNASVSGLTGACVLEHRGSYTAEGLRADAAMVPGSGTGAFQNHRGGGLYTWPAGVEVGSLAMELEA